MAITRVSIGTAVAGTTSLSLPLPASLASGNLLVAITANKYPAAPPAVPASWEFQGSLAGGVGASGIDSGQALISFYTFRIPAAGITGNVVFTITGGNASRGRIFQYTKTPNIGTVWGFAFASGAQNVAGLAWAVTASSNPGITAGDMVIAGSAVNGDGAAGTTTFSLQVLLATGITLGTEAEIDDGVTANGDDLGMFVSEHPILTGTAIAAPTYSALASATSGSTPAGATGFLRLRELPGLPGGDLAGGVSDAGVIAEGTAAHKVHYNSDVCILTTGPNRDFTAPTIGNFVPASGSAILITDSIRLDMTDAIPGLLSETILVLYGDGSTEVAWDGLAFSAAFLASSTSTSITNGLRFLLIRTGGWPNPSVTLKLRAVDIDGNVTTANPSWTTNFVPPPPTGALAMRGFDTTLGFPVYWVSPIIDTLAFYYTGPGPVTQIAVFKVLAAPT